MAPRDPRRHGAWSPWASCTAVVLLLATIGCAHRGAAPEDSAPRGWSEKGVASWYGEPYHGRRTASGEVYDMHQLTAAHRTLPFGTLIRVTRRDGDGRSVEVRVNDRGPFIRGRIVDLSYAGAKRIGLDRDGIAPVRLEVVGHREAPRSPAAAAPRPAAATECWWVQVGAFSDLDNARRARARLEALGYPAVVMESPTGLDRVRAGPFADRDRAAAALARLTPEYPPARLVPCGE